jgi:hypothetical protein
MTFEDKEIYATINDDASPLKSPAVCDTRWISVEPVVTRILLQWNELKTFFIWQKYLKLHTQLISYIT